MAEASCGSDSIAVCGEAAVSAVFSGVGKLMSSYTVGSSDMLGVGRATSLGCDTIGSLDCVWIEVWWCEPGPAH